MTFFRSGRSVEAIDVLGQDDHLLKVSLHLSNDLMASIWLSGQGDPSDFGKIFPGEFRPASEHRPGQGLVDRDAFLGHLAFIEPSDPAISRQARVGRKAGPGDEKDPCVRMKFSGDRLDYFL